MKIKVQQIEFEDGRQGVQYITPEGQIVAVIVQRDADGKPVSEIYSVVADPLKVMRSLNELDGVTWRVI